MLLTIEIWTSHITLLFSKILKHTHLSNLFRFHHVLFHILVHILFNKLLFFYKLFYFIYSSNLLNIITLSNYRLFTAQLKSIILYLKKD